MNHHPIPAIAILLLPLAITIVGLLCFHRYTGLSRGSAFLVVLASAIAGGIHFYHRGIVRQVINRSNEIEIAASIFAVGLCYVFLAAFVLRLWGRWVGEHATAEERLSGQPGIRAWFSAPNVFVGAVLVLCAWLGFDISPLLGIVVVGAALAAAPVIRMESLAASAPAPVAEDLSAEREKIVSMLEAGKLTPEESADLLQALGDSSRARVASPVPLTGSQRLMLIGAALVAVGFFLPWVVINPGKELGRVMSQTGVTMDMPFAGAPQINFPAGRARTNVSTPTAHYAGGDIGRGLGWAALALALGAALLPYLATSLDAATTRTVRLLCLGTGGLIVLYLLTQNLRFVGIGLVLAVGGYAVQIAGAMRERRVLGTW